jgi:Mg2+/Co2+ transporter CorB
MLRSILDLVDVDVEDVMTHRSNVTTLNIESSIEQIVDDVLDSPYTRIPVWKNDKDNIIGIIHAKILLKELRHIGGSVEKLSIDSILMEPWFVPETTTLFDQLQAFRERKEHFAIVVDEYGAFQGIVTLEDVLEEIVGEIDDEQDLETTGIHVQDDGSYLVEGTLTVRDLNRELDWNLPDEDYTTIAGLIIYESKMVPDVGQSFLFYGYRFQIMQRERNQITSLKITAPKRQND